MREITENITKVTYIGNCPSCGIKQTGLMESYVDVVCYKCRQDDTKLSDSMMLTGAVIESVEYDDDQIVKVNIISPDGLRGTLETMCDSEEIYYYAGSMS